MGITLRPHQLAAVDSVVDYWKDGGGNALVSACVASGKSFMAAALAERLMTDYPGVRLLGLTMTKELIAQNAEAMRDYAPHRVCGINSAGLKRRDTTEDVIWAHPKSIIRTMRALGPRHVLMVDECQNLSHDQEKTVYGKIIAEMRRTVPDLRTVGLTGTPWRLSSGRLDEPWKNNKPLFDKLVYEYTITQGIDEGYLVPPLARRPKLVLDVTGVNSRGGEYIESELQAAVDKDDMNSSIVEDILEQTTDRRSCLVFATGIKHAQHLLDEFNKRSVPALLITGEMPDKERDAAIDFFKRGLCKYAVNVGVLTTGFNYPALDAIAIVRPTQSGGLLIQMGGRVLRTSHGKTNGLILDYGNNFQRLGCIDQINGRKAETAGGPAPTKTCPVCSTIHPASKATCNSCGHVFPASAVEERLTPKAVDVPVMSNQIESKWLNVTRVTYSLHQKTKMGDRGTYENVGQPSLRISYVCGVTVVSEWLAFESDKPGGRFLARSKWQARATTISTPETAKEALGMVGNLRKPGRIQVRRVGKYDEFMSADFSTAPTDEKIGTWAMT